MAKKKVTPKKVMKAAAPKTAIGIVPLSDRVVVRPMSADDMGTKTASGIIIPDTAKEKPMEGTVVAVGPGKYEDGMRVPVGVTVGDRVMFSKYGFDSIKKDGVEYYIIGESNILAIIK